MNLTAEDLQAARRGETVRLISDGVELVVLRADLFAEAQKHLDEWTPEEMRELAIRTFEDADRAERIEP